MRISLSDLESELVCPACKQPIMQVSDGYSCTYSECGRKYPIIDGHPILINEDNSIFRIEEYQNFALKSNYNDEGLITSLANKIRMLVPSLNRNWRAKDNFKKLKSLVRTQNHNKILVVGAGEEGEGAKILSQDPEIGLFETDIYLGERVQAVADGHDLPFNKETFDAVVIQAVLEHVIDPIRCVSEIYRVLKPGGLVYAETPFLYPVHLGPYDFTRYTYSGHRRLFNCFSELESGMSSGPASALVLAIRSFFLGLSNSRWMSGFATIILPFFIFWVKYFDFFMLNKPYSTDYGTTFYFLGEKTNTILEDTELINYHWSKNDHK